ncbi:MAG TPA: NAD-dependent epimerase/dehydratase family protein, partial [Phycisphaerae bacterium]|nr:NAD-dependent epimerase/dehydratase family protein [Phycisphaerae bacterium]
MKVLYIGGTGRISYACVLAGARAGHEITVFNRGRSAEPLPSGVRRITGDLDDEAAYRRLGAETYDAVCQFKAYDLARVELDLAVFGGRCGQYVFISTASAYQKPPRTVRITEEVPLANPYWPYSQAKADMERRLMEWHEAGKLPVTVVRPSHTTRGTFPGTFIGGNDIAWRMRSGKPTISHGDGTSLWVLTDAEDFAEPFVRLLGNPRALGEAFHITGDEAHTWDQIFAAVGE